MVSTSQTSQGGTAGTREMNAVVNNQIATSPEDVRRQQILEATSAGGGRVLGVMPEFLRKREVLYDDVEDADDYTANVLQYSVGINFNQFLFENSTLGVRYGSFAGTNVTFDPNINGADDNASDISDGDEPDTGTQVTNGYEIVWNYYGLEFGYGAYFNGNGADTAAPSATGGQAFSILYTVNF